MNIAIFLGTNIPIQSKYLSYIDELMILLKHYSNKIIYGGTSRGLMGYLGNAAIKNKIYITGVISQDIQNLETPLANLNNIIIVKDLYMRKKKMFQLSEICMALPGGFGTLDEIFEAIILKQIKYHNKKIIFLNILGYYDFLQKFIAHMYNEGFISQEIFSNIFFINDIDSLAPHLKDDMKNF